MIISLMVASITIPKGATKVQPTKTDATTATVARPHSSRQYALKRGGFSSPQRRTPTMKFASPKSAYSFPLSTNYPRSNQTSPSLFNYQNLNVCVVGNVGHPKAQIVRVVHISDTRGVSDYYANGLPNGHILIHSGDFLDGPPLRHRIPLRLGRFHKPQTDETFSPAEDYVWKAKLREIDDFFRRQPHPYKIFVSGCWDYLGPDRPSREEIQKHLPSAIYLEDSYCEILGLKIYGIPWTSADDLRPEDGKSYFASSIANSKVKSIVPQWLLRSRRQSKRQRCQSGSVGISQESSSVWPSYRSTDNSNESGSKTAVCEFGSSSLTASSTSTSSSTTSSASAVTSSNLCDGFILPDIRAVEERYSRVPSDTNIIVSHMPAWRPELYTHVVERIQPYLHLCGHDFTGYGVTWRRGVVFSNAAVQLTPTYPRVMPYYPFPRRRKAYSSTFSSVGGIGENNDGSGGDKRTQNLFVGTSAPSKVAERDGGLGAHGGITTLPPNIPRFNDIGVRPRRWRRRLSSILGRLSLLLNSHSFTESPVGPSAYYGGRASRRIQLTPSSVAAQRSGGGDFVVDPTISVFGSEASAGSRRDDYVGKRNPLVFDVYVVIEEGVNDCRVLPDYSLKTSSTLILHENLPLLEPSPQAMNKNIPCCLQ